MNIFSKTIHKCTQLKLLLYSRFYEKHRFPGEVGCIDCTHVAVVAPNENEHIYVNRKGYHSINVQLVSIHIYI